MFLLVCYRAPLVDLNLLEKVLPPLFPKTQVSCQPWPQKGMGIYRGVNRLSQAYPQEVGIWSFRVPRRGFSNFGCARLASGAAFKHEDTPRTGGTKYGVNCDVNPLPTRDRYLPRNTLLLNKYNFPQNQKLFVSGLHPHFVVMLPKVLTSRGVLPENLLFHLLRNIFNFPLWALKGIYHYWT